MNVSVRADELHAKSLALDHTGPSIPAHARTDRAVTTETNPSSLVMFALGLGGVVTLVWVGILLWMAGFLIGFW